ncbi:MAG: winged helix-turn-helix domain-containing protein [Planctomycetaceae bacterium]|nr:winged helix-turn-helix domain-containing protein [Planctomycetaceae bacterium]
MSAASSSCTAQIGETAGVVWHKLAENGPMTMAQLAKQIDASRDMVMQAIGWLAREGKVEIEESGRKRLVTLR